MPSWPMQSKYNSNRLYNYCTLLLSIILINSYLFYSYSKAINPTNEKTLIYGILSGENLLIVIFFTTTSMLLSLVLSTILKKGSLKTSLIISYLICLIFTTCSWQSYRTIGDFLGSYSLQMLMNDGFQILELGSRMPSMISIDIFSYLAFSICFTLYFSLSKGKATKALKRPIITLSALTIAVIIWNSISFNKFDSFSATGDINLDEKILRIQKTNFELASIHAGPFTKVAKEFMSNWRESSTGITINQDTLSPIIKSNTDVETAAMGSAGQMNVVYIIVESLRSDILGSEYDGIPLMPFTSKLAEKSYNFTKVWAQSSHSNYSDIATISGQYPLRSELIHFYPKEPSYPLSKPWDHLRKYGYSSALVSSQNEHWGGMSNYLQSENLDLFNHVGNSNPTLTQTAAKTSGNLTLNDDGTYVLEFGNFMYRGLEGNSTQRYDEDSVELATEWVSTIDNEQPFLLFMNFQASHYPYNFLPNSYIRKHLTGDSAEETKVRNGDLKGGTVRLIKKAYYDSLEYIDSNIEKIFTEIESKTPGKTIYVITADTGTHMDSAFLGNGGSLLPDVIHIPAIIYDPRYGKREIIDKNVAQIDLIPTVYGLLGVERSPSAQGIDALKNRPTSGRAIFSVAQTPAAHEYSVVEDDWQLIFNYQTETNSALYVGNRKDISAADMPKEKMQSMALKLQHWISTQLQYYGNEKYYKNFYPPAQSYFESQHTSAL